MPLLYLAQSIEGRVTRDGLREVAALLDVTTAEVEAVASFYTMLRLRPDRPARRVGVHEPVVRPARCERGLRHGARGRRDPARRGAVRRTSSSRCTRRSAWARARRRPVVSIDFVYHDDVTPERMRELVAQPPGGRGARSVARRADGRLPRGIPPAGRPATAPGGGRVSLEFERVITANWGDDSVRSLDGYEAKGGYAGLRAGARDGAGRRDRGGEGLRAPRPRRRRLPDGDEVVVRAAGHGQAHVRHRELRRVGAGHVQQPRADGARAAPDARGRDDRGVRDPLPHGVRLLPRGVPVAGHGRAARDRGAVRRRLCGQGHPGQRLRPGHRACTAAPARTSAGRRRRCCPPSRGSVASRGCARPSRPSRASTSRRR